MRGLEEVEIAGLLILRCRTADSTQATSPANNTAQSVDKSGEKLFLFCA